jgi:hypothetical protein
MTDYTTLPLGLLAPNRDDKIVKCPHCGRHGLELEDYKYPTAHTTEKELIYIHQEGSIFIRTEENGRPIEIVQTIADACPIKIKLKSPEEKPRA